MKKLIKAVFVACVFSLSTLVLSLESGGGMKPLGDLCGPATCVTSFFPSSGLLGPSPAGNLAPPLVDADQPDLLPPPGCTFNPTGGALICN